MLMTTIGKVKEYLEDNVAPRAWMRIQLRVLPHLNKKGLFLHTMTDDQTLDEEILELIAEAVEDAYQAKMPVLD